MAPKGWAAEDQATFLLDQEQSFREAQVTRRFEDLWSNIMAEWNRRWPVIEIAFPGQNLKLEDLNEEQLKIYNTTLEKVRKRVKQWIFWRFNQRGRQVAAGATAKDLRSILASSGGRLLKDYEMYVKVVAEGFDEFHSESCEKMGLAGRQKIQLWHTNAKAYFEMASPEEREAVATRMLEQEEIKKTLKTAAETESLTPAQHQHFLNILPGVLSATVDPAVRKAGVMAFVCVVGPVPKEGGKIVATSYQFGDQKDTPLFASTWDKYDQVFTNELGNFARRHLFSKEVCALRALLDSRKCEDLDADKSLEDAPVVSNDGPSSGHWAAPQKDTPPPPPAASRVSPDPMHSSGDNENLQTMPASGSTAPHELNLYLPDKLPLNHPDFSAPGVTACATDSNSASSLVPNFNGMESWDFDFGDAPWADPVTLEAMANGTDFSNAPNFLADTPSLSIPTLDSRNGALPSGGNSGHSLGLMGANMPPPQLQTPNPGLFLPHVQPHTPSSMSWTNPLSYSEAGQIAPVQQATATAPTSTKPTTPTPPPGATPTPPNTTAPQPSGATRSSSSVSTPPSQPSTQASSNQSSAKTDKPAAPIPPVQSAITSQPTPLSTIPPIPAQSAPASNPPQPVQSPGKQIPPTASSLTQPNQTSPSTDLTDTTDQVPPPDSRSQPLQSSSAVNTEVRRSSRGGIPSTRLEQLNAIGTNPPPPPKAVQPAIVTPPLWFDPALEHLSSKAELGPHFLALVDKWQELEVQANYGGKSNKGLSAKGRPEEWAKLKMVKSTGSRNYSQAPNILDAAEFGIAVARWWAEMQPPFRKNTSSVLPLPVYDSGDISLGDPWANVRKFGPAGLSCLLIMMSWWGSAALKSSQWNDDPKPLWEGLVDDVGRVFDILRSTTSARKRRHDGEAGDGGKENKRTRTR
ncbi:hypothetical protein MD484_g5953, partial [Candolleomyces efflorescens]